MGKVQILLLLVAFCFAVTGKFRAFRLLLSMDPYYPYRVIFEC